MTTMPDTAALARALTRDPRFADVTAGDLELLEGHGVAHGHFRVAGAAVDGRPALLRVPRLSQWGMDPRENLAYQTACFGRAEPSGRTPRLFGSLTVSESLPWGALVIEEIEGRKPRLPGEMEKVAETLAAIHALPLPEGRAPLRVHDEPVADTLAVIREQAAYIDQAALGPEADKQLRNELAILHRVPEETAGLPNCQTLVVTDAHPGNYLVEAGGRAVFVDLEKALYGLPAIDLAHASLYTSTMWDPDIATALTSGETRRFYESYLARIPRGIAAAIEPWLMPARRLTWLRTLTWMIRWKVLSSREGAWSAEALPAPLREQLRRTVEHYLQPETIAVMRERLEF